MMRFNSSLPPALSAIATIGLPVALSIAVGGDRIIPASGAVKEGTIFSVTPQNSTNDPYTEPDCLFGDLKQPDPADCTKAAANLKADDDYTKVLTYTENYPILSPQTTRLVPVLWEHGSCLIILDCKLESEDQRFSLVDAVWPKVSVLFRKCLYGRKPGHNFGGIVGVVGGFELRVQYVDGGGTNIATQR